MTQVNSQTGAPAGQNNNQVQVVEVEKSLADNVLNRIKVFEETGTLNLPKGYSAPNALRIGWLMLQDTKTRDGRKVLEACTKESIANSLLRMIILGLNPAKRQGSFIAYGNELTFQREYQGTIAIAKRHGVKNVTGCAVFKDDVFEYIILEDGTKKVTTHKQTIESIESGVVKAAYATKEYEDGRKVTEVMAMSQIRKAWAQGATKGESPAHKNFPDEMAIKTVINRLLKQDVNSSDDADLFTEDQDEKINTINPVAADVKHQISERANRVEAGFEDQGQEETPTTRPVLETETANNECPGY